MKSSIQTLGVAAGAAAVSAMALLPFAAFAQTSVDASGVEPVTSITPSATALTVTPAGASVNVSAGGTSVNVSANGTVNTSVNAKGRGSNGGVTSAAVITRANTEIDQRITNLNSLSTRIGDMKNVSASDKSSLQASISTEISNLTSLKTTIDAQTTIADLKTDVQEITKDYRIYMLVIPQGRITAASDRAISIVSDFQALSAKLQTRITAAQTAGKDVSAATAAYADMQAKVTDANTQATAAATAVAGLQPDQGDTSVAASNTATLKASAAQIKTATADLKAARADVTTILKAIKGTGNVSASTSASASAGTQ